MPVTNTPEPEVHWDQTAFEKLKATWSPQRIAADEKTLTKIFNLAADCPLLAEELDWAKKHGIKFFVDHTAVNCGGYYSPGAGVFAIVEKYASDPAYVSYVVDAIVHELRHAWQDYHGLLNYSAPDFTRSFIKDALIEADAKAFGNRAVDQYRVAKLKKQHKKVPASLNISLKNEAADLGKKFLSWFSNSYYPQYYGDELSKFYGQRYGLFPIDKTKLDKGLPIGGEELSTNEAFGTGININNIEDVLQLGENFSGTKNYLVALPPCYLRNKILNPALADTFWGAANDEQIKLTTALHEAYEKKKRAAQRKKRHRL